MDESDNGRLQVFAHIRDPLEASKKAAQTVMTRLDQVVSVGSISLSFGKVLNKETSAALHVLDQTKSVLDLALTADQRFVYHFVSPGFEMLSFVNLHHFDPRRAERYSNRSKHTFGT